MTFEAIWGCSVAELVWSVGVQAQAVLVVGFDSGRGFLET